MKTWLALGVVIAATAVGQGTVESHRAAAKVAAGKDLVGLYNRVCPDPPIVPGAAPAAAPAAAAKGKAAPTTQPTDPPREQWYAEPVKVFDNLYFLGTKVHESWAITTSDGIIILDTLYSYATEPEIEGGLRKLGLDPTKIKYIVLSHGHGDHHAGAKYLQDKFGPRLIAGAPDWDLMERDARNPKPRKDMVATDGQKLTLGDETLTLYLTPGHTLGTISTLVPVKDGRTAHLAAEWGGTAFSNVTPVEQLRQYVSSAARFRDIAVGAGADVIITNHTDFDGALPKLAALGTRKAGDPNPYVVGKDAVKRYLTVAEECGRAALAAVK